jgi:hypothetical protein
MGGLPETQVAQRADGVLVANGQPVRHDYVLAEEAVPLAGAIVARDERKGMVLRRTDGLVRIGFRISGLYPNDVWSGPRVTYTRLRCTGGRLTARIASDANLFAVPQTVRSGQRSVTFRPSQTVSLTVPLRPQAGICRATFAVTPTAIPATAEPGSQDARVLGARFLGFTYSAP